MDELALDMSGQIRLPSIDPRFAVDLRGPGEWIVGAPAGGRSLHVYRLAAADWLVSEVGCRNEGRGADLIEALTALPPVSPCRPGGSSWPRRSTMAAARCSREHLRAEGASEGRERAVELTAGLQAIPSGAVS